MSPGNTQFGSISIDWESEPVPNLGQYDSYEQARANFEWDIPETFNIATDVVTRHADRRGQVALFQRIEDEGEQTYTFWQLERESNRLANALEARGVGQGDRVAIVGARSDRVMLAHLAAWKLGAVSVPLSTLYGADALEFRLSDCDASAVFVDQDLSETLADALESIDTVECVVEMGGTTSHIEGIETVGFDEIDGETSYEAVETAADDPALILYTSGTTGRPKGVVQDHQSLLGWLPSFQMCFELPWHDSDPLLYATPDLAWIGGINLVLGSWHYGFPAFRYDSRTGFDPKTVFENIDRYGPTRAVLVPGMLKPMSQLDASQYDLDALQVVMSGSEPVSEQLHEYVTETLGANLNEMYGQTEAMHLVTSCSQWFDADPGSLGYPAPGHDVRIIDEDGTECETGETGIIGLKSPDPTMLVELWNDDEATERKFVADGEWMNTDDLGYCDEDGQLWFKSRADDLIITNGYRVGPAEVEDSIRELDQVREVGIIGVEDDGRGEIIKAYIEPSGGVADDDQLKEVVRSHVKTNLAKYEYPREITFIDEVPTTVTGKIKRTKLEEHERESQA
ncbi:AMP-binding protein [Natrialba sp. INN-245]|uniref:acyl-CoA synthetase n=1 Tax=Natrialba sp. INN-245 TaxID=2690967 RepID=UPI00130FB440|nr:AMP-binding protein [Natrialba sp. INN-245]MWV38424.1 AMP-binding protein [Natrialba sp. INN-245]